MSNTRMMLTIAQAVEHGFRPGYVRSQIRHGRWQNPHRGVVATFPGPIPRDLEIHGVLLAAGDSAAISHYTAAELAGLTDKRRDLVHVTIPWGRRVEEISGAFVHVSRRLDRARHPTRVPAQTRVEATVFDLSDMASNIDEAVGWLVAACERGLTTPERIASFLKFRGRTRWRPEMAEALNDIENGCQSLLELRYFRDVERAHKLPKGQRQAPHERFGGRIYDDVRYSEFNVVVELDGRVAHPGTSLFRDLRRDNQAAIRGDVVLHYGWSDVTDRPCGIATQVAGVLTASGWQGLPRRCKRPDCGAGGA